MQRFLTTARTLLRNRAFLELLVCNVLLGLTYSFVGPFMSLFGTQEVKMSNAVFGVFMTISSVTAIVLSTWLAHWSDTRYSRRSMLLLGSVCGILGYLLGGSWQVAPEMTAFAGMIVGGILGCLILKGYEKKINNNQTKAEITGIISG